MRPLIASAAPAATKTIPPTVIGIVEPPVRGRFPPGSTMLVGLVDGAVVASEPTLVDVLVEPRPTMVVEVVEPPAIVVEVVGATVVVVGATVVVVGATVV
ncbi:MAG TPA: hypothetical protein VGP92_17065, partial [Acidimicrobiia bacterium]|nr:hypothetical protein [Acidimicrobiia bacterium]